MRALVAGFITIDTIQLPVRTINSIGGPPCYAGLICSRFGLEVFALTKVGNDFPDDQSIWLSRNGISLRGIDRSQTKKTTRFRIQVRGEKRSLSLITRCEDVSKEQIPDYNFNASLISPIANEISYEIAGEIAKRSDFTFLDPQGYVRSFSEKGDVSIKSMDDDSILKYIDAIKMDRDEAKAITGKDEPTEALSRLSAKGIRKAIITQGGNSCYVLDGRKVYAIPVPKVQIVDSTGAGDILAGTLVASYLRTREFLWSACFGVAASSLSLNMIALAKIDLPMSVDSQARRLYSQTSHVVSL